MENMDVRKNNGGRAKISQPFTGNQGRMHFSKRAMKGKISVMEIECPYCHHHKSFSFDSSNSPYYGELKCTKCKKHFEV
jgi:ribosomal protein L44E